MGLFKGAILFKIRYSEHVFCITAWKERTTYSGRVLCCDGAATLTNLLFGNGFPRTIILTLMALRATLGQVSF